VVSGDSDDHWAGAASEAPFPGTVGVAAGSSVRVRWPREIRSPVQACRSAPFPQGICRQLRLFDEDEGDDAGPVQAVVPAWITPTGDPRASSTVAYGQRVSALSRIT